MAGSPRLPVEKQQQIFEALIAAESKSYDDIAEEVGVNRKTVTAYRDRWIDSGYLTVDELSQVRLNPDVENPFIQRPSPPDDPGPPEPEPEHDDTGAFVDARPRETLEPDSEPAASPTAGEDPDEEERWALPTKPPPPPPGQVEGPIAEPSSVDEIAAGVFTFKSFQIPIHVVSAHRLMLEDGLDLNLNDWVVAALEEHLSECRGVRVGLIKLPPPAPQPPAPTLPRPSVGRTSAA